jgi:peptide/nickel transport system permease protein
MVDLSLPAEIAANESSARFQALRELARRPAALVGISIIAIVAVMAIFAPLLAPYPPNAPDVLAQFQGPSAAHWLGTDYIGRDILSRLIYGSRTALEIALPAVAVGFLPGLLLGLAAGYVGGFLDKAVLMLIDTTLSIPGIVLAFTVLPLFGPSVKTLVALIAVAFTAYYGRLARAQTLAAKQNLYVKAERSLGASRSRIILRHILPNVVPPLLILAAMDIPGAISLEAGLAFLGIGLQPPVSDWGIMLNNGFSSIRTSPWGLIGPLAMLTLVTTAFTLLGETLRDVTDPKLVGAIPRRRRLLKRTRL